MKILVCGGRNFADYAKLEQALDELNPEMIINGDAKGADQLSSLWARRNQIPFWCFPAKWSTYGKAAGFIRDKDMLFTSNPDLVLAFVGGRDTKNMIELAKDHNIYFMQIL